MTGLLRAPRIDRRGILDIGVSTTVRYLDIKEPAPPTPRSWAELFGIRGAALDCQR
jgi:hypothetical protein